VTLPERSGRFANQAGKLFERSEFFPARKMSAQRRVPEGQGGGARFSAYSFAAQ